MEKKISHNNPGNSKQLQIPLPIKVVIGGLAYGIIKDESLKLLLDDESYHEFDSNFMILYEFAKWFINPKEKVLKSRDHLIVLRYLMSAYLRAYHRNLKHRIVRKLSNTGRVITVRHDVLMRKLVAKHMMLVMIK